MLIPLLQDLVSKRLLISPLVHMPWPELSLGIDVTPGERIRACDASSHYCDGYSVHTALPGIPLGFRK